MTAIRIRQFILRRYLLSHPLPVRQKRYLSLMRWHWLKPHLELIKPEVLPTAALIPEPVLLLPDGLLSKPGIQPFPTYYQQYSCRESNPLNCAQSLDRPFPAGESGCLSCGFPQRLRPQSIIVGNRGRYRVERCLGQRGIGRLYEGVQLGSEQPITIKEYVLPRRYFSELEQQQRQEAFLRLAGLVLADGRHSDLRTVLPLDAIAPPLEERCYLITPVEDQGMTLSVLLEQRPAFTAAEVWQVVNQVLQTLACLHSQKFSLPMGQVQVGATHGRLSLSSLLWVTQGQNWFIYLTDFARWEQVFDPMTAALDSVAAVQQDWVQQDLAQLGQTAFYLLQGRMTDAAGKPLNPKVEAHWLPTYLPLQALILRLLGVGSPFESAEAARQALLSLPPEPQGAGSNLPVLCAPVAKPTLSDYWVPALGLLVGMGLLGGLAWLMVRSQTVKAIDLPALCCLKDVAAVPGGSFIDVSIEGDGWSQLRAADATAAPPPDLISLIGVAHPNIGLKHRAVASADAALEQLRAGQADFAVLPILSPLPLEFEAEVVAYDGLAVVVPFSYVQRDQSLPDALRGAITLDTLRQIYTGQVERWPYRALSDLPVRAYVPSDRSAVHIFEQRVLQQAPAIADFQRRSADPKPRLETIPLLRSILRDFEVDRVGSIGFAPLSAIVGQCSVYPLAVQATGQPPAQPLVMADEQPIQPTTDLCRLKGSYGVDAEALRSQTYPLAYPVAVVWLRDNRRLPVGKKVAELLLTQEGQQQLGALGWVPQDLNLE